MGHHQGKVADVENLSFRKAEEKNTHNPTLRLRFGLEVPSDTKWKASWKKVWTKNADFYGNQRKEDLIGVDYEDLSSTCNSILTEVKHCRRSDSESYQKHIDVASYSTHA